MLKLEMGSVERRKSKKEAIQLGDYVSTLYSEF